MTSIDLPSSIGLNGYGLSNLDVAVLEVYADFITNYTSSGDHLVTFPDWVDTWFNNIFMTLYGAVSTFTVDVIPSLNGVYNRTFGQVIVTSIDRPSSISANDYGLSNLDVTVLEVYSEFGTSFTCTGDDFVTFRNVVDNWFFNYFSGFY